MNPLRRLAAALSAAAILSLSAPAGPGGGLAAAPLTVVDPGQGAVALPKGATAASELSGLAWTGGSSWLAVGDNGAKVLWQVEAGIDGATGRILTSTVSGSIAAPALGSDSEGIAYRPDLGGVWVTDEVASTIIPVALPGGVAPSAVTVPAIYTPANVQSNMGLESLAWSGSTLWTANEEALVPDGAVSTTTAGSLVRIQRFDAAGTATGQWAYRTDPIAAMNPFITQERSGVVDIVTWSATTLLVLERELGGAIVPTFRSRLYAVDVAGAADVSAVASLLDPGVTPLAKTLLWERSFASSNFEGMSWGPEAGGGRSLVLVSDDGGGMTQSLYALVVVPEPGPLLLPLAAAGTALLIAAVRRMRRAGRTGGTSAA